MAAECTEPGRAGGRRYAGNAVEYLHALTGVEAYALICFLVFLEEAGIPLPFLPGDLLLLAGGYLAAIHVVHISLFIVLAFVAAVSGAFCCYTASRRLGRPFLERHGRFLGVTQKRLERAETWLGRRGAPAIFVFRILPGTRINASFAAGCLKLPAARFAAGVVPSAALFVTAYSLLGFAAGERVTPLLPVVDRVIAVLLVLALVGGLIAWQLRRRLHPRSTEVRSA